MAYAPGTVNGGWRTSAAETSRVLPVSRAPTRNVRSVSGGRATLADRVVKAHTETLGRQALEEMFAASRSRFIATAYSILRNREDAEDAVQNAFLSGYLHLRSFEGRSALKTWFTRIVLNAALMIQRKRKQSPIPMLLENGTSHEVNWFETIPASQSDPETTHAEREAFDFINRIIEEMKPKLRQALTMTYFDELSIAEACALLGVSSSTFKARLFRARRELLNQAQQALLVPIHKMTPPDARISQNVDNPSAWEDSNL